MCTAVTVFGKNGYFGRNLDYFYDFGQKLVITPRKYPFAFTDGHMSDDHYAIIGIAVLECSYPLYFDAVNERGLSCAGLNFPDNAVYFSSGGDKKNIASFELIPRILSECSDTSEARELLSDAVITDCVFSERFSPTPLHWIVSDNKSSLVVEQTSSGLELYDNPTGVLTNNPPFDFQLYNLSNYMMLSENPPENNFASSFDIRADSVGMGAVGLPGDNSSRSRFVRAAFTREKTVFGDNEDENVSRFFHILEGVRQVYGVCATEKGYERTLYSSCCNMSEGTYYFRNEKSLCTYSAHLHKHILDGQAPISHDLPTDAGIIPLY